MRNLTVTKNNESDFSGIMAQVEDYGLLLDEDCVVTREDGSLLCVLLKGALDKDKVDQAWLAIKGDSFWTNNRGIATGAERIIKNKQHVLKKEDEVQSGIIGFYERTPRLPYCRACAWNLKHPEKMSLLTPLIEQADQLLRTHAAERYAKQAIYANKASRDFLIGNTNFSTLTVNKNFRTAYHKDVGNVAEGISAMAVIKQGRWTGANLCFPAYEIAVKLDHGDLVIFDPHEFHGNTELFRLSKDAVRCSIVFYFREKISECLSAKEELERVQNRKQGEQLHTTKLRKKKHE